MSVFRHRVKVYCRPFTFTFYGPGVDDRAEAQQIDELLKDDAAKLDEVYAIAERILLRLVIAAEIDADTGETMPENWRAELETSGYLRGDAGLQTLGNLFQWRPSVSLVDRERPGGPGA